MRKALEVGKLTEIGDLVLTEEQACQVSTVLERLEIVNFVDWERNDFDERHTSENGNVAEVEAPHVQLPNVSD